MDFNGYNILRLLIFVIGLVKGVYAIDCYEDSIDQTGKCESLNVEIYSTRRRKSWSCAKPKCDSQKTVLTCPSGGIFTCGNVYHKISSLQCSVWDINTGNAADEPVIACTGHTENSQGFPVTTAPPPITRPTRATTTTTACENQQIGKDTKQTCHCRETTFIALFVITFLFLIITVIIIIYLIRSIRRASTKSAVQAAQAQVQANQAHINQSFNRGAYQQWPGVEDGEQPPDYNSLPQTSNVYTTSMSGMNVSNIPTENAYYSVPVIGSKPNGSQPTRSANRAGADDHSDIPEGHAFGGNYYSGREAAGNQNEAAECQNARPNVTPSAPNTESPAAPPRPTWTLSQTNLTENDGLEHSYDDYSAINDDEQQYSQYCNPDNGVSQNAYSNEENIYMNTNR